MAGWLVLIIVVWFLWSLSAAAAKWEPKPPRISNLKLEISELEPAREGTLDRMTSRQRKEAARRLAPYGRTLSEGAKLE
jgi:hypothetical protein